MHFIYYSINYNQTNINFFQAKTTTVTTTTAAVTTTSLSPSTNTQTPSPVARKQETSLPFGLGGSFALWNVWTVTIGFFILSGVVIAAVFMGIIKGIRRLKKKIENSKVKTKEEGLNGETGEKEPLLNKSETTMGKL